MASVYASEDVEPKPSKIEATKTEKMDDLKKKVNKFHLKELNYLFITSYIDQIFQVFV